MPLEASKKAYLLTVAVCELVRASLAPLPSGNGAFALVFFVGDVRERCVCSRTGATQEPCDYMGVAL